MSGAKPKLAMYWGASCGGCEISLANVHEVLLEIDAFFEFMFCPCLLDTKKSHIEDLPDGDIFLTFFNGAIRTEENLDMARLLRRKSRLLVAFGACAATGGIPSLANHHGSAHVIETAFCISPSIGITERLIPGISSSVPEGELQLPPLLDRVHSLSELLRVDYTMPGCPPESGQIVAVLRHIISGKPLPPPGSFLGCSDRSVCDECPLEKRSTLTKRLFRTFEVIPEPGWCLVEQGLPCVGSATRGGCGALCPSVNMPCSGCYGAVDPHADPGAASLAAIAAVVAPLARGGDSDNQLSARMGEAIAAIADPVGTFYRYSLATTVIADREPEEPHESENNH